MALRYASRIAGLLLSLGLAACAVPSATPSPAPAGAVAVSAAAWETRLAGDGVILLGEQHDHAGLHALRFQLLRRAVRAGWRPAIAMEQFDTDRQADIDRARRERPRDAEHLIRQSSPAQSGWDWRHYRPVIALALEYALPLVAANLPRGEARRLVQEDYDSVLGPHRAGELGLHGPLAASLSPAQQREIATAHGSLFPAALLPGMTRAQLARDASMALVMKQHRQGGVVLLAGNGHVRGDIGVARWLRADPALQAWTVGFLERQSGAQAAQAAASAAWFDAVVWSDVSASE